MIARQDAAGLAARPSELEPFIVAAGDLVRRFIFALASSKLRHAGLTHAANALMRANQQAGHALPDEFFQNIGPVAALGEVNDILAVPDDIPAQFQRILSDFENAEALSDFIACLWGYWLAPNWAIAGDRHGAQRSHFSSLEPSRRRFAARLHFRTTLPGGHWLAGQKAILTYSGLPPPPWPPPVVGPPHSSAL